MRMYNILYAIIFCIVGFLMWMSILFSYANKRYGVDKLFFTVRSSICTYVIAITISVILTVFTYIVVSFVQSFI